MCETCDNASKLITDISSLHSVRGLNIYEQLIGEIIRKLPPLYTYAPYHILIGSTVETDHSHDPQDEFNNFIKNFRLNYLNN